MQTSLHVFSLTLTRVGVAIQHQVCVIYFIPHASSLGVEPVVTHQTSWLESTGVCGVQPLKLVGALFKQEPNVPLLVVVSALLADHSASPVAALSAESS